MVWNVEDWVQGEMTASNLLQVDRNPVKSCFSTNMINTNILKFMIWRLAQAPVGVKEYVSQNETFSCSDDHSKGKGGDYVNKTKNKHLNSNLPKIFKIWQMASRNHRIFHQNRLSASSKKGKKWPCEPKKFSI